MKLKVETALCEHENLIENDRTEAPYGGDNAEENICSYFKTDCTVVEIPLDDDNDTTSHITYKPENPKRDISLQLSKSEPVETIKSECECVLNIESDLSENTNSQMNVSDMNRELKNNTAHKLVYDTVSLSEPCCRVCQCNEEEEKLISPCHCSGSVKWIHETCLVHWMKSSFKDSCELCMKKIEITKQRKPFSKWKLPSQRPTPVLWILVFVTAIALNLASVVKDASRLCSSTPCLVFYAVGCIGVILGTLFLIYWTKRAKSFINHWLEQNEEWVVVLEEKEKESSPLEIEGNSKEHENTIL